MSRFLMQRFAGLHAYTPGEQPQDMQYIKLNTNESPYPPAPAVFDAVNANEVGKLRLYPDPEGKRLKEKLAALYGVKAENIFLSNGSDDILNFAFLAFCDDTHPVLFPEISYGFYSVYADLYGIQAKKIPLQYDFSIDITPYCNADGMVVIANPNAPTGLLLPQQKIEQILQSNPEHMVVIDEAYIDFGGTSCSNLIEKYDNLLVVQTFSKSRSMAGARLGFAIASAQIIEDLNKIKYSTNPYSINRLTLAAGEAAVDSNQYYIDLCEKIISTRTRTVTRLREIGFTVLDSAANFVFAKSNGIPGGELYCRLKEKGILVRHFENEKIKDYIRITIGTDAQMAICVDQLEQLQKEYANENG